MLVTSLMFPTKHETKQLKEEEDFVGLQSPWGTRESIIGRNRRRVKSHFIHTQEAERKQEVDLGNKTSGPAHRELFPWVRFHLLRFHNLPR